MVSHWSHNFLYEAPALMFDAFELQPSLVLKFLPDPVGVFCSGPSRIVFPGVELVARPFRSILHLARPSQVPYSAQQKHVQVRYVIDFDLHFQ